MEKKTPLLDEIGRKHGMKVPAIILPISPKDDGKFAGKGISRTRATFVMASGKTVDLYGSHVCRYMAYDENVYGNILGGKRRNS